MIDWESKKVGANGGILLLELSGRLGSTECDYLLTVVGEEVDAGHRNLIIDCADVEYISSSGLGLLMRIHRRMKGAGGNVSLTGVRGIVADAIKLVKLNKVLHLYSTIDEAIASYST